MQHPLAVTLLAALCTAITAVGAAALAGEFEAGRDLAQKLCARCHLNEGQGEKMAPSEIPGFRAIANRPGTSEESIVAWLRSLPEAMPNHHLSQEEMESLAIFIFSLRARP
jgi:mono/diheme cytochrome c family protein